MNSDSIKRLAYTIRLIVAVLRGAITAGVRRVVRGPTLPTWSWSEELFVAISRAMARATARNVEFMAPRRDRWRPPLSRLAKASLTVEDVDLRGVRGERYSPNGPHLGTILYFHGGGFVSGSANLERRPAAAQAMASNCDTYSINYRLAPRHPFPAALDDAIDSYRALLDRGAQPETTIFFGGSAGAGLALSALLKIRDLKLPQPAGAVLLWPYADFTFSGQSILTNADIDMLPVRDLAHVWGPAYVGLADPSDPLVSPALADLTSLPPLLILTGGAESLRSCAELIAVNARAASVETQLTVYPEKVHGWMILPKLPATLQAIEEINTWISDHITHP